MAQLSTKRVLSTQEEKLASLRKQHKTLLKRITTERNKLTRFKDEMQRIMQSSSGLMSSKLQALHKIQAELQEVLEQCAKSKVFSKSERKNLHWMKEDLQDMFADFEQPQMTEEEFAKFVREQAEERERMGFDFFNHFAPPVPEEQQRSIREVYKRLAVKFHPDKASGNAALEKRFHAIMQRINTAYQHGDIADLLAVEAEYAELEDILSGEDAPLRDLVEQEIERLRAELDLCQSQLERLKSERKGVERTQEGKLVKDFQKAVKVGIDPMEEMTRDLDNTINELTFQKELYERLLKGEISKEEFEHEAEKHIQGNFVPDMDEISADEFFSMLEDLSAEFFQEMERDARGSKHKSTRASRPSPGASRKTSKRS